MNIQALQSHRFGKALAIWNGKEELILFNAQGHRFTGSTNCVEKIGKTKRSTLVWVVDEDSDNMTSH